MGSLWNPFADMSEVDDHQLLINRGEGVHVYDADGRGYIDASAALWFCHVGYGRTEIAEAMAEQAARLHTFHLFGAYANEPACALADRLKELSPFPEAKVFFTSGGSDAVDTAAKLVRRFHRIMGNPERTVFLSRTASYHGMHGFGTSLAGIDANRNGYGELMPTTALVDWDSITGLEVTIDRVGSDRFAGFFCEPVLGAGGVRFPPPGYLEKAAQVVRDAGGLFIADEVVTGFGRMGSWFGSSRLGIEPDLVTFAKGATSGYTPLGGVIANRHVAEPFWHLERSVKFRHGYTYSGHAVSARASLANIDIIEKEGLLEKARRLETTIHELFGPLRDHPLISEVRLGNGAMAGLQVSTEAARRDPTLLPRLGSSIQEAGVILRTLYDGTLQISPPLIATRADLEDIAHTVTHCLDRLDG